MAHYDPSTGAQDKGQIQHGRSRFMVCERCSKARLKEFKEKIERGEDPGVFRQVGSADLAAHDRLVHP